MKIANAIAQSIEVKQAILEDKALLSLIEQVSLQAAEILKNKGRILLCGNGGSAADAQHIAAELSGRFAFDREPLDAEALSVNTSYLTAVANDYSFDAVYSRLVKAKGRSGDMLIAISTSGNSQNIINAVQSAKELGMVVVGFTGSKGGKMKDLCDHILRIPSDDTPRIQESHIMIGHIFCQLIEDTLFAR
ncbi:MAG: D-sedoheptulose 7-phosphate isomerase [Bacteroidota bacterium]